MYTSPMAKTLTRFVCQSCGRAGAKPLGRCPSCGEWNTYVEEIVEGTWSRRVPSGNGAHPRSAPRPLAQIEGGAEADRLPLSIGEFARVLGGGIVPGSLILLGGDPGIGKSTLLLQTAIELAPIGPVLYVSGEESAAQIKMRADRIRNQAGVAEGNSKGLPDSLFVITETNVEAILRHVESVKPRVLIIDSIQTVYDPEVDSSAGSVTQLRDCADRFRNLAKSSGLAIFL